jgi:hypothetical protein
LGSGKSRVEEVHSVHIRRGLLSAV